MVIEANYISILIAGIVSMALGFVWYSPFVFGKIWMKEKGLTKEVLAKNQRKMQKFYLLSFIASLVTAFVLAQIIFLSNFFSGASFLQTGIMVGFFAWLGFVLPVQFTAIIFGSQNWKLLALDAGYQLVSLLAMGVVLASIR